MSANPTINIEVAYALPEKQVIIPVNVDVGTTVGEAIAQSGIMQEFPQIDVDNRLSDWATSRMVNTARAPKLEGTSCVAAARACRTLDTGSSPTVPALTV